MKKVFDIILLPIKWLIIVLIYFYKLCISPFLQKNCAYYPTCSTFMLEAIKEYGIIIGLILGIKRLLRCTPKYKGKEDYVPLNLSGENKWIF